jgi:hypothetical protein
LLLGHFRLSTISIVRKGPPGFAQRVGGPTNLHSLFLFQICRTSAVSHQERMPLVFSGTSYQIGNLLSQHFDRPPRSWLLVQRALSPAEGRRRQTDRSLRPMRAGLTFRNIGRVIVIHTMANDG